MNGFFLVDFFDVNVFIDFKRDSFVCYCCIDDWIELNSIECLLSLHGFRGWKCERNKRNRWQSIDWNAAIFFTRNFCSFLSDSTLDYTHISMHVLLISGQRLLNILNGPILTSNYIQFISFAFSAYFPNNKYSLFFPLFLPQQRVFFLFSNILNVRNWKIQFQVNWFAFSREKKIERTEKTSSLLQFYGTNI